MLIAVFRHDLWNEFVGNLISIYEKTYKDLRYGWNVNVYGDVFLFFSLQSEDKARVLCFVEFTDAKCAKIALDALQGAF